MTARATQSIDSGIEEVLEREQVHSVFQPIIDLDSGAVVAYEALARGPVGPLERPDRLFAAARTAGRLADLDELCRRVAIRGAIDAGIDAPLTLFVNIEPEILDTAKLEDLLSIADSAPGTLQLVLEITERALAARPAELLAAVRGRRAAGWRIALDDVGAHDVSLAFMPLLRPDIIKLDLQVVQRRPGPKVAEIMNAVNAYAERTGSVILAEGIEDEQHLAAARALGARLGQGFMFGRPSRSTAPGRVLGALQLPPLAAPTAAASPFMCLPDSVPLRRSTKPLLLEVSKHLEREAMRLGGTCLVVSTFQDARHFGPVTARRYRELAGRVAFVAAIGAGLPAEPTSGVRGADLEFGDPVHGEWDVVILAPHFAAALIARDLDAAGPDLERTFQFALTYDRHTVEVAAQSLMARVRPHGIPVSTPLTVVIPRSAPADAAGELSLVGVHSADPLTGLLDRRRLEERLETCVLEARIAETGAALLYLRLDDLPTINEQHGRLIGDELLRATADRLRRRLRRGDLIARIDGAAFIVVLPGLDQVGATAQGRHIAAGLAAELSIPVVTEQCRIEASVSTGVSAFPADGQGLDELLHAADVRRHTDRSRPRDR